MRPRDTILLAILCLLSIAGWAFAIRQGYETAMHVRAFNECRSDLQFLLRSDKLNLWRLNWRKYGK